MKKSDLKREIPNFRNLRDITQYSGSNIKSNMLFRSSDLSAYEKDPLLTKWFDQQGIKTIIDLRNRKDIMRRTYSPNILRHINYINLILVSEETENKIIGRDNTEYYTWVLTHERENLKELFTILANKENYPLIIHCHVGMDRTGIVLALIHLLLDSSRENIIKDYLASGPNMKQYLINLILQITDNNGGITHYLKELDISEKIQHQIIRNLTK